MQAAPTPCPGLRLLLQLEGVAGEASKVSGAAAQPGEGRLRRLELRAGKLRSAGRSWRRGAEGGRQRGVRGVEIGE